jgi:TonB-dependent receptor
VNGDEIVVTGIRASLAASADIKREAQGVVDAISAEDIGKFPDTNLAESLQRITGVSIDRSNGEGSLVTVRGFGPEFNLVTLNGRQMPTALIGGGDNAPSSRSFDFDNIASEGIAGVEVYKSGRVTMESGGIGSIINLRTPRPLDKPGLRGSLAVKGVYDSSRNEGNPITPEVSGILSTTFANDTIGILITGSYQKRKSSENNANVGWRDGYLGSENNWGSLAQPGTPRAANITNRPDPTDVYQVPQNASYDLNDVNRERINGQAVLQFRRATRSPRRSTIPMPATPSKRATAMSVCGSTTKTRRARGPTARSPARSSTPNALRHRQVCRDRTRSMAARIYPTAAR